MSKFLEVTNLNVTFPTVDGDVHASNEVTYSVGLGETLAIVEAVDKYSDVRQQNQWTQTKHELIAHAMACGQTLTRPSEKIASNVARMGFTNEPMPLYTDGKSPLGWLEWPALLRMLDRLDPSYRD
jgi:hypothetical protein